MHNSVMAIFILPALFLLCSCTHGIGVRFSEGSYETDMITLHSKLPQFDYGENPAFSDEVNNEIRQIISVVSEDAAKRASEHGKKAKLEAISEITFNDGRIVSIVTEFTQDTGGAHPEKTRVCRTYDFIGARRVFLEDIFIDDEWKKAVDAEMERRTKEDKEYSGLWEIPSTELLNTENFYFKENGKTVFFFPPYDLSYYRRGFVEFDFSKEELSGFIKPELILKN